MQRWWRDAMQGSRMLGAAFVLTLDGLESYIYLFNWLSHTFAPHSHNRSRKKCWS
jgi:hypothetical protein